ncbi:MAG: alpha/beta hydrolase [Nitrospiraceae bacterium]
MRQERLGGLLVRITGGTDGKGGGGGPVVILLHGFGAPGDDLVPLGETIKGPVGTRYVFPVGPLSFQMGFGESRAWWMIDMDQLNRDLATGRVRDLSNKIPQGLAEARERVVTMLGELDSLLEADPRKTVLGGFSQGAMLAGDVALRTERQFAGLVLLSGTLIAKDEWLPLMPRRNHLPVFQSHGSMDPLLPVSLAEQLQGHLFDAGFDVEWVGFHGGHEIPDEVTVRLGEFILRVTGG